MKTKGCIMKHQPKNRDGLRKTGTIKGIKLKLKIKKIRTEMKNKTYEKL